jgi:glucan-binding YG repeat protein
MLTGWQFIDGYWYFFDIYNGNMLTNTYIASSDGSMMYYIKPDGRMQTGWVNFHGDKYIDPVSGVVTKTR